MVTLVTEEVLLNTDPVASQKCVVFAAFGRTHEPGMYIKPR